MTSLNKGLLGQQASFQVTLALCTSADHWQGVEFREYLAKECPSRVLKPLYRLFGLWAIPLSTLAVSLAAVVMYFLTSALVPLLLVVCFTLAVMKGFWATARVDKQGVYYRRFGFGDKERHTLPETVRRLSNEILQIHPSAHIRVAYIGTDPALLASKSFWSYGTPVCVWREELFRFCRVPPPSTFYASR